MEHKHSYKTTVKKLPETSEVEIKAVISADEFSAAVQETLSSIKADMELPGFRKGTAPEKLVREKVGEAALLKEAAEHAISHAYGHIIHDEKIDAIGHPKVSITKLAEGNPLEFTLVTAVVPQVKSLDYKKIAAAEMAKKAEAPTVTDEELAKAKERIPEATREDLLKEKEYRAVEKKRLELVEALTKGIDVVVPEALVDGELGRMAEQMAHDIGRMGLKFDDYLKHIKKTPEELMKDWRPDALKRVKLDLALAHIAKAEKLSPDKQKVEDEIKHAQEHHKDIDLDRARSYFEHIFLNQAVFEFLEKQR
ncbi:MAG TPA: trigger factor [Candidatus Paceibacterota bacterium]|nr:trigger factor [Candidatus Paceibacterota bacterium]